MSCLLESPDIEVPLHQKLKPNLIGKLVVINFQVFGYIYLVFSSNFVLKVNARTPEGWTALVAAADKV